MSNDQETIQDQEAPERSIDFRPSEEGYEDPAAVFADPIGYLRMLGLEAELIETGSSGWLRAA